MGSILLLFGFDGAPPAQEQRAGPSATINKYKAATYFSYKAVAFSDTSQAPQWGRGGGEQGSGVCRPIFLTVRYER